MSAIIINIAFGLTGFPRMHRLENLNDFRVFVFHQLLAGFLLFQVFSNYITPCFHFSKQSSFKAVNLDVTLTGPETHQLKSYLL